MASCATCGAEHRPGAAACTRCGAPAPMAPTEPHALWAAPSTPPTSARTPVVPAPGAHVAPTAWPPLPPPPPGEGRPARTGVVVALAAGAAVLVCVVLVAVGLAARGDDGETVAVPTAEDGSEVEPSGEGDDEPLDGDPSGEGTSVGEGVAWEELDALEVGDCLDEAADGFGPSVEVVPCEAPHRAEVYEVVTLDDGAYPGDGELADLADESCYGDAFFDYVGTPYATSQIYATSFSPTSQTWAQGDRGIACFAHEQDPTERVSGSYEGSGR